VSQTAYFNEPLPLRRQYPDEGVQLFEGMLLVVAILAMLVGLCIASAASDFRTNQRDMLTIYTAGIAITALGGFLLWISIGLSKWEKAWTWKYAFLNNNADLHLNVEAIERVIQHFQENTGYHGVDFKRVATELGWSLRTPYPFDEKAHNTLSWEALNAYRFFATGQGALIPTFCKK